MNMQSNAGEVSKNVVYEFVLTSLAVNMSVLDDQQRLTTSTSSMQTLDEIEKTI